MKLSAIIKVTLLLLLLVVSVRASTVVTFKKTDGKNVYSTEYLIKQLNKDLEQLTTRMDNEINHQGFDAAGTKDVNKANEKLKLISKALERGEDVATPTTTTQDERDDLARMRYKIKYAKKKMQK